MSNTFNHTNTLSVEWAEPNFRLRAFADYCDKQKKYAAELIGIISEAISMVPDDSEEDIVQVSATDILNTIKSNHPDVNFDNYISLSQGYVTLNDAVIFAINETVKDMNNEEGSTISLQNASGNVSGDIDFDTLTDDIKSSLHSLTTLTGAVKACEQPTSADKITYFNDFIKTEFQNVYSDVSNSYAYYKDMLINSTDSIGFMNSIFSSMQVDELSEDNSISIPANSPVYEYTGASPMTGLASGAAMAQNVVTTTINIGAKVVGGICKAVGGLLQKGFSWVKKKVVEIVADPYDIEVINSDSQNHCCDGLSYQMAASDAFNNLAYGFPTVGTYMGIVDTAAKARKLVEAANKNANSWIKFSTLGGDLLLRYKSADYRFDGGNYDPHHVQIYGLEYAYQPKTLDYTQFSSLFVNAISTYDGGDGYVSRWIYNSKLQEIAKNIRNSSSIYADVSNQEIDLLKSFRMAIAADYMYATANATEDGEFSTHNIASNDYDLLTSPNVTSATNADFFKIATGWNGDTANPKYGVESEMGLYVYNMVLVQILNFLINQVAESENPLEFPFLPYRKNAEGLTVGRFGIKKDSTNIKAFETFISAAIIVVLAVAATLVGVRICKSITRAVFNKNYKLQRLYEAKVANGGKLTAKEFKKYNRAKNKLAKLNKVSSGLQAGASSNTTTNDPSSVFIQEVNEPILTNVDEVKALIS